MLFGPMEHILWEAVASHKPVDIDATASALTELLWSALRAPARVVSRSHRARTSAPVRPGPHPYRYQLKKKPTWLPSALGPPELGR
jgi:hypothetical protein